MCLVLLSLGWSEARQLQYGLASVDGFCQGWGQLDQLGDVLIFGAIIIVESNAIDKMTVVVQAK